MARKSGVSASGEVKGLPHLHWFGLKLVKGLPKSLTKYFQVMILVDTAFGSVDFLHGIRQLKYHAIAGIRCDRQLIDGRSLRQLHKRGQQVHLAGLKFPVSVSWYYLKRDNGQLEKRFVLSTKQSHCPALLLGGVVADGKSRVGLKLALHRFGLHRFGQGTLLGVYRWLVLSLIAYILAHWAYLSTQSTDLPDWGQAAQIALQAIFPQLLVFLLLLDLERMRPLALSHGIDIQISRCKI